MSALRGGSGSSRWFTAASQGFCSLTWFTSASLRFTAPKMRGTVCVKCLNLKKTHKKMSLLVVQPLRLGTHPTELRGFLLQFFLVAWKWSNMDRKRRNSFFLLNLNSTTIFCFFLFVSPSLSKLCHNK